MTPYISSEYLVNENENEKKKERRAQGKWIDQIINVEGVCR